MHKKVSDVMQPTVMTVKSSMDIHALARFLTENRISGAPVLDDKDRLVGVVSLSDLAAHHGRVGDSEAQAHAYWRSDPHLPKGFHVDDMTRSQTTVGEIMTPAVFSIPPEANLVELCDFFLKGDIHRVLVTEGPALRGIVTSTDLIRELRHQLTHGSTALTK